MWTMSFTNRNIMPVFAIILIVTGVVLFALTYWPSGISIDEDNNISMNVVLGKARKVPADAVTVSEVPDGLLSHLIRTNGLSMGKYNYGYFRNVRSKQKMFLYLTGREKKVCFEYNGLLYVVDDWRD